MKALPSLNRLYTEKKEKGLHIFIVYAQGHPREEVEKFLKDKGCNVPCPFTGSDFGGYRDGWSGLPYGFVIGPDAKVVWEGRSGYEAVIDKQLARIKYPGLGKLDVAPGLEKAATLFSTGEYAKASEEASKLKEKKADDAALVADADFIIGRVDQTAKDLQAKADETQTTRRYHETVKALEKLAKGFKGTEIGDKADEDLKNLKKDKDVKKELSAWDALEKTLAANEKAKDSAAKKKSLNDFYKKYEGTAAADEAKRMAEAIA
ncbi:MAG: hypothetical protein IPK87_15480 [Planctomycetes bacterium]|nr:hypothetical protein [Planctomycetota bacterium]